jgi:hypothetical protein
MIFMTRHAYASFCLSGTGAPAEGDDTGVQAGVVRKVSLAG